MIPPDIKKAHILQAIEQVKRHGVPKGRQSRKFLLEHKGCAFPPKYVVSLACGLATGRPLGSDEFGGGSETNGFLARLGFKVVMAGGGPTPREPRRPTVHNERCSSCKRRVGALLKRIYGSVEERKSFDVPARLDALLTRHHALGLKRVYESLTSLRGHTDLVRRSRMPHCDYFVPKPGFVVEFDESQHFTAPRAAALAAYPDTLRLGFERERWKRLCERINAHDNDPPHRDEQRAWYDSLRDFLPLLKDGLLPTARIHAADMHWCELSTRSPEHRALFRDWLGLPCHFEVKPRLTGGRRPFWGRVIVRGPWYAGVVQARRLLEAVCDNWPHGVRTRILVTSGGFVSFKWPKNVDRDMIGDDRQPGSEAVRALFEEADRAVESMLTPKLRSKLTRCTDAISIGVDSFKTQISLAGERIRDLHVELVYFVDLRDGRTHRTGKSYPTVGQENGLLRIRDVSSHFTEFDGDTVLLLGCHDLKAFDPRGNAKVQRAWRKEIINCMHKAVARRRPKVVVHHPHTTDSGRIWRNAWGRLLQVAGSVESYASAGRYYNDGDKPRDTIEGVLASTVAGDSIDLITRVLPDRG